MPARPVTLGAPVGAPFRFDVEVAHDGDGRTIRIEGPGPRTCTYALPRAGHAAYLDLFAAIAVDFGTRVPLSRRACELPEQRVRLDSVLTEPVSPDIRYGYGDPCVLHVPDGPGGPAWYLIVTSNDAPQTFPILRSTDLVSWETRRQRIPGQRGLGSRLAGRDVGPAHPLG